MSDIDVSISDTSDQFNQLTVSVIRRLNDAEEEQMRRTLAEVWDLGFSAGYNADHDHEPPRNPFWLREPTP